MESGLFQVTFDASRLHPGRRYVILHFEYLIDLNARLPLGVQGRSQLAEGFAARGYDREKRTSRDERHPRHQVAMAINQQRL